ncbi:hypothetical protein EUX98_g3453 [Antrodiella citrinella]|uniref:RING-type domain-containing protein n=1 Tax=Antrodiella citrinella TaxID=2447956 RepID=A0A4S4MYY8_9APHY|nr:hypothetical protein EUX98_g3453 [Antrodiella citrinella]
MSTLASLPTAAPDVPGPSSMASMQQQHDTSGDQTVAPLKRTASSAFESAEDSSSRKKLKEDTSESEMAIAISEPTVDGHALADELEQELQCGCCSALVYRPVLVHPCQHFFCGSCVIQWVRNGGTNCPACRGISLSVTPSRALQTIADVLSRAAPSRARSINERMQADEIYKPGLNLRIPTPRQPSPEPNLQANNNYTHPCPHCAAGNQWGWRCSQPIADPDADPDNAWNADDGTPPGHGFCGNCENILAIQAPTSSKCDFCQVSFCGIGIPGRCVAAPLASQHPHGLSDLADLIQCGEIYDCFDHNTVEVDIMFDYLATQNFTPRHIYREPLFDLDLFMDVHAVSGGTDPDPNGPRQRICRVCATEVLLWGLREWWVQERKKGFLEEEIMKRPDCPEGTGCSRQKDQAHAKEFNHIIAITDPVAPAPSDPVAEDVQMQPPEQAEADAEVPIQVDVVFNAAINPAPPVPAALQEQQPQAGPSSQVIEEAPRIDRVTVEAFTPPPTGPAASHTVPSSQDQVNAML